MLILDGPLEGKRRWIPYGQEAPKYSEWEYELPGGREQHHDQEGKIYFTKSEDGLLTETWIDPRWQDSWDKFHRARQQNKMQIKRPQVILAKQARKSWYRKDRRPAR